MSIVLIDETLPLPDWAQGGQSDMRNTSADGSQPIVMHVPSITWLLFMKDKSKLPIIQSAGDVICCENRHGAENLSYAPKSTSANSSSFALEAHLSLVVNCKAQPMIGRCRASAMIRGQVSILASTCLEPKSFGSGANSAYRNIQQCRRIAIYLLLDWENTMITLKFANQAISQLPSRQ